MSHKHSAGQRLYEELRLCFKLSVAETVPWHKLSEATRKAYEASAKIVPPNVIAIADETEEE